MRLQVQVLFVIGIFSILSISFLYFFVKPSLLHKANQFDQQRLHEDVKRTYNYINLELKRLYNLNRDWAVWEDSYDFIQGNDEGYIERNLENDTFSNNQIHFMIFLDENNRVVLKQGYDFENNAELTIPNKLITNMISSIQNFENKGKSLLYSYNNEAFMISTHVITKSDGSGDFVGSLLIGRIINNEYVRNLEENLSLSISISPYSPNTRLENTRDTTQTGGTYLEDGNGNPILAVKIEQNRLFFLQVKNDLKVLTICIIAGIFILSLFIYFCLKVIAIRPISRISSQVKNLNFNDSIEKIVEDRTYNKEMKELYYSINQMLCELKDSHNEIRHMAYHDQLTDLNNRYFLMKEFPHYIEFMNSPIAVVVIDLDGFKEVNDSWGHDVGDSLIKQVADRLIKSFANQSNVIISRIGGDEFVILLPFKDSLTLHKTIREVIEEIGQEYLLDQIKATISASVGISCYPEDGETLKTLLNKADKAMYQIKREGKNGYIVFRDSI